MEMSARNPISKGEKGGMFAFSSASLNHKHTVLQKLGNDDLGLQRTHHEAMLRNRSEIFKCGVLTGKQ